MIIYLIISNLLTLLIILFFVVRHIGFISNQKVFKKLIDHANVGYYRYRCEDGALLSANEAFLRILELDMPLSKVIGRPLNDLLIYVDREPNIYEQLKQKSRLRNYEYRFKTLKGKDKCLLHNSYLIRDPYTNEEVIEALIEDITEERLSYERMKTSQERYEKLFKSSGDMVIIYDINDFKIEETNSITELITGFSEKELINEFFLNLLHPSHRLKFKESQEDLLFTGSARLNSVLVCKDGMYKEVIMTMSTVEFGDKTLAMAVIKDISLLAREREREREREKELENFCKASIAREERIKDLRQELNIAKQEIKLLKEKGEKY